MNPRVKQILSIEPYSIRALWTDDRERIIDFTSFLSNYSADQNSYFSKLLKTETFLSAKTDGRTIYWDGIAEMLDYEGRIISAPLDFDPDVLLQMSL